MRTIQVLLLDSTSTYKQLLENKTLNPDTLKLCVTHARVKHAEAIFTDVCEQIDVIMFSERVSSLAVVQLTKLFRERKPTVPIFILTKESEVHLSRKYQSAGVDDVLNVAEIDTPLFSWSFTSAIENAILKKKAKAYDAIHIRLQNVNQELTSLIHDINNPLSVIRLALYQLENPDLPKERRATFVKLLVENLKRIEGRMGKLYDIRRKISSNGVSGMGIFSLRAPAMRVVSGRRS